MAPSGQGWRDLWPFARTWSGYLAAGLSVLLAIFYSPKKMLETYDWYLYRFVDQKTKEYLEKSVTPECPTMHGPRIWGIPKSIPEISNGTALSARQVTASLKRLEKKSLVVSDRDNWKIKI